MTPQEAPRLKSIGCIISPVVVSRLYSMIRIAERDDDGKTTPLGRPGFPASHRVRPFPGSHA